MKKDFNEFRFEGLNCRKKSNNYLTMNRVSEKEDKIVVKVSSCHLKKTKFGYALILNKSHVVFLKDWQVSENYFGNEVLINKDFFNVKEWGIHEEFDNSNKNLTFENWLKIAKEQESAVDEDGYRINPVLWENNPKKAFEKMIYGI